MSGTHLSWEASVTTPKRNSINVVTSVEIDGHSRPDVIELHTEYHGDKLRDKQDKTIRIGFININGLPKYKSSAKYDSIHQSIKACEIDILGIAESNRCWHKMLPDNTWQTISKEWWKDSKSCIAYNLQDLDSKIYQPGGTITVAIEGLCHRVRESGVDDRKLGRWSWLTLQGKNNLKTTIITTYRCCKTLTGTTSTYSQQVRYYNKTNHIACPRSQVLQDLSQFIKLLQDNDHQIIVLADMNEKITSNTIKRWAQELGLREIITDVHGATEATFHRGSVPIDGIFVSASLMHFNASGYLPFGYFMSDHRMLWIDIPESAILGFNLPPLMTPKARKLQCGDPRISNKWNALYSTYIKEHNLHNRVFQLEALSSYPPSNFVQQEFDNIMAERRAAIAYADKHCRHVKAGGVPFSPPIQKQRTIIELWEGVSTRLAGNKFSSSKLRRLAKKAQIDQPLHNTAEEVKVLLKQAYVDYYKLKKDAHKLRDTHLDKLAEAVAEEKEVNKSSIIKQLKHREAQRTAARSIRFTLKKLKGGSVTKVEVTKNGQNVELTNELDIFQACAEENNQKYHQTDNTPCMQEPLFSLLGNFANTPFSLAILNGTANFPANIPHFTKLLLQHLKKPQHVNLDEVDPYVSVEEYQQGWKKMKEYTTAGISGIHFGHLKSCARDSFLAQFESSLAQISYGSGVSSAFWQKSVICMIKKKQQEEHISRLRSIVLTEADFNFNNKILGRTTLQVAENNNMIAKEQYGSRKGRSSIDHALHKRLFYDIARQFRLPAALCSNDAKSCYDRIVHLIAILAYRRCGIAQPPVEGMFRTIQNMKHHFRTAHGDLLFCLENDSFTPFQGSLQGNGASPTTWVIISSVLIEMMRNLRHGGIITTPLSNKTHQIVALAYVDDTDLIIMDLKDSGITGDEIMDRMQQAIEAWEGGLKATGGAIVPHKSWVYPIDFAFNDKGEWRYKTIQEIDASFQVKDENDNTMNLQQLDSTTGKETLGVILAPDGSNTAAIEHLLNKTKEWKALIKAGHLKKDLAWQAAGTTIMKTIQYPLPALTLSPKDCTKITQPIKQVALPKTSISKNYPLDVLFGPTEEGGLGMEHLYTLQGAMHIEKFQCYLGTDSITGIFLQTSLEAAQLEIGIGRSIFLLPYEEFGYLLTDCWIKHLWKYSNQTNIQILDFHTKFPSLQRENDLFLMEIFHNEGYKKKKMKNINRCRQYLQVLTLSDVMNGYGDGFSLTYLCRKDPTRESPFRWPRQPRPNSSTIRDWKSALRKTLGMQHGITTYKLGRWLHNDFHRWRWFFVESTEKLYQRFGSTWRLWERKYPQGILGRFPLFVYHSNAFSLPESAMRATIQQAQHNTVQVTGWSKHHIGRDEPWQRNISSSWILDNFQMIHGTLESLAQFLSNGELRVVCDGSYYPVEKIGGAAWFIESEDTSQLGKGSCVVPGSADSQSSSRSELMGILATIMTVTKIAKQFQINEAQCNIHCDGNSAIQAISNNFEVIHNNRKHYDLLQSIHSARHNSNITFEFIHIKGHADDELPFHSLTREQLMDFETSKTQNY